MISPASAPSSLIDLPPGFRVADFLRFYGRDAEHVSERVSGNTVDKALLWQGQPALISLTFVTTDSGSGTTLQHANQVRAQASHTGMQDALPSLARRLLGLHEPIEAFEQRYREHDQLGKLIAGNPGLRIPNTITPFEALTWAIIGQLVSVAAAVSIRRRLIRYCHQQDQHQPDNKTPRELRELFAAPNAEAILQHTAEQLRETGVTKAKAETLRHVSHAVIGGDLPLLTDEAADITKRDTPDALRESDARELSKQLLAIKGIGEWTVNYVLMRGYGYLDSSLHGDVAVRRNLQTLLNLDDKPSIPDTKDWLANFTPYRGLVAAHLWAQQSAAGY